MKERVYKSILICLLISVVFMLSGGLSACTSESRIGATDVQTKANIEEDTSAVDSTEYTPTLASENQLNCNRKWYNSILDVCFSDSSGTTAGQTEANVTEDVSTVDPTELEQAIASANELHETDYNRDEWYDFWQVYIYADDVLTRGTTQEEMDEAADSLNAAIRELTSPGAEDGTNQVIPRVVVGVIVIVCVVAVITIAAVRKKKK